jgi:hypothetical protein
MDDIVVDGVLEVRAVVRVVEVELGVLVEFSVKSSGASPSQYRSYVPRTECVAAIVPHPPAVDL